MSEALDRPEAHAVLDWNGVVVGAHWGPFGRDRAANDTRLLAAEGARRRQDVVDHRRACGTCVEGGVCDAVASLERQVTDPPRGEWCGLQLQEVHDA